jgi:hypothetical protein
MKGFKIRTQDDAVIRFQYYSAEAPASCRAFDKSLPFNRILVHARVSGQEIWTDDAPAFDVIQENASVFTEPGEVVLGPIKPVRTKTAKCLGIYYGEGKGLDAANIFACVLKEDLHLLKALGEKTWKQGEQTIFFEQLED